MDESDYRVQEIEWRNFAKACHAKGACEFSGLNVLKCVRSICDCFETEDGAKDIIAKATEPVVQDGP